MEFPTHTSITELGMDHSFLHQWQMGSLDELCPLSMAAAINENYSDIQLSLNHIHMFNQEQEQPPSNLFENEFNRPLKLQKTNSWGSSITDELFNSTLPASADTHVITQSNHSNNVIINPKLEINFSSVSMNFSSPDSIDSQYHVINNNGRGIKRANSISPKVANANAHAQAQDHVMAERRRRERLSQKFIALSALVPGLKRMDKASVLGDAINYLKKLQERVNKLEEKTKKQTMEFVKKHQVSSDKYRNSSSESDEEAITVPIVELEARYSGKDVLVRIHCEKKKRIVDKVVAEIQKFPLNVDKSSVMSFGNSALDITVIAQMEEGFKMSIKDFVKKLDYQLQYLIGKYNKQEDTSLD